MKYAKSAPQDVITFSHMLRNKIHVPKAWYWIKPGDIFRLITQIDARIRGTDFNWTYFGDPYHALGWHLSCPTPPTKREIKKSKLSQEHWYRKLIAPETLIPEFYRPEAALRWLSKN